jgi:DNA-3-methyladenine glycosylase
MHRAILGTLPASVNYNGVAMRRTIVGSMPRPFPRAFYARDTVTVARELLGSTLVRRARGVTLRGRIVETEAYVGEEDLACHARAGRTARTEPLYGPPGFAYVYLTYGMHHLLNAVTEPKGRPAAVLLRALEPLEGGERMARARGVSAPHLWTSGPAKLCEALGVDLRLNRTDLRGPAIWIEPGEEIPDERVRTSPRIGCERVPAPWAAMPWRFYVVDSPFVTPGRPRHGAVRRPARGETHGDKARGDRE